MEGRVRTITNRRAASAVLVVLLVTACSPTDAAPSSTTTSAATTTTAAPTTTVADPTTTTTEAPVVLIRVSGVDDVELSEAIALGLSTIRDPRAGGPVLDGVVAHHAEVAADLVDTYTAETTVAELADGSRVAVATLDDGDDIVLLADEGDGWSIVGTDLGSVGAAPYFGDSPRRILVLGSDARPGGDPTVHRMDSIHILTSVPSEHAGSILGYPRDSWIDSEYGSMRINALTSSSRGPDALFDFFTETWEVPLEGYILTGFAGFEDLVGAAFGRLEVTVPIPIPTQEWFDGFGKGDQALNPTRLLDFVRTRKLIPGGDFTRSRNQGLVMLAALSTIQHGSIHDLPGLLATLTKYTTTNLTTTDLIQLAAAGFEMDTEDVTNEVLAGSLGRAGGGASVVFLDPGFETIVADVTDDGLRNDSSG